MASAAPQFSTGGFGTQRSREWSRSMRDKLYLWEITAHGEAENFTAHFQTVAPHSQRAAPDAGRDGAPLEGNSVCKVIVRLPAACLRPINGPRVTLLRPFPRS